MMGDQGNIIMPMITTMLMILVDGGGGNDDDDILVVAEFVEVRTRSVRWSCTVQLDQTISSQGPSALSTPHRRTRPHTTEPQQRPCNECTLTTLSMPAHCH